MTRLFVNNNSPSPNPIVNLFFNVGVIVPLYYLTVGHVFFVFIFFRIHNIISQAPICYWERRKQLDTAVRGTILGEV